MTAATVGAALAAARAALAAEPHPDVSARTLVAHVLSTGPGAVVGRLREPLPPGAAAAVAALADRVAGGEPLAYVVGHQPFLDVSLRVDRSVLIPRPETEGLAEWALGWAAARAAAGRPVRRVLDVGTGSGALAIVLARGCPDAAVVATDIAPDALVVAAGNAARLGVAARVTCVLADLVLPAPAADAARDDPAGAAAAMAALAGRFDLVVANLPYIGTDEVGDVAAGVLAHEPAGALFAGPDGLDLVRRLLPLLGPRLAPGAAVGLEIGYRQGETVAALAAAALPGAAVRIGDDVFGRPRYVLVETAAC